MVVHSVHAAKYAPTVYIIIIALSQKDRIFLQTDIFTTAVESAGKIALDKKFYIQRVKSHPMLAGAAKENQKKSKDFSNWGLILLK